MKQESMERFSFPGEDGGFWKSEEGKRVLEGEKV
jgi:L-galactonate dehydratase